MKKIMLIIFCLFSISCTSNYEHLKDQGFRNFIYAHNLIPKDESFHKIINLKNIKIHIVSDPLLINPKNLLALGFNLLGCATSSNNEIYIIGHKSKGKIFVNQAILGHEIAHLLNFKDPSIPNPDKELKSR